LRRLRLHRALGCLWDISQGQAARELGISVRSFKRYAERVSTESQAG
jgi:hypothetical protein